MNIKQAIEYFNSTKSDLRDETLCLLEFAEKYAKKTAWVNVYINQKTCKTWTSEHFEDHITAVQKIVSPDTEDGKYVSTVKVEYYIEY